MCFDGDPATIYREKSVDRARKNHLCDECRRMIERGDSYRYITMLFDGDWTSYHVCRFCFAASQWLRIVCGSYGIGGLSEELWEHWQDDTLYRSHWLGRAILGVRNRWAGYSKPLPDPTPLLKRKGLAVYTAVAA